MATPSQAVLALTTPVTLPASCTDTITVALELDYDTMSSLTLSTYLEMGFVQGGIAGDTIASACYPTGFSQASYYSPGVCPHDWEQCTRITVTSADTATNFSPGETVAWCCPGGYTCQTTGTFGYYKDCVSTVSTVVSATVLSSLSMGDRIPTGAAWNPYPTSVSKGTVDAFGVQVRWRNGDGIDDQPSTVSSSSAPTNSGAVNANVGSGGHGISKGAVIGIAVAVPVVCLALLILAVLLLLRRKKRRNTPNAAGDKSPSDLSEVVKLEEKTWHPKGSARLSDPSADHGPQLAEMPASNVGGAKKAEEGLEVIHELAHPEDQAVVPPLPPPAQEMPTTVAAIEGQQASLPEGHKELSRESEGLIPAEELAPSTASAAGHADSARDALERELQQVREERERLYMEQLTRRERELEQRLQSLGDRK